MRTHNCRAVDRHIPSDSHWLNARRATVAAFVVFVWVVPAKAACAQEQTPAQPVSNQTASRDAVDARAPEDRRATAVLGRIKRAIERQEWNTVLPQLQGLLEQPTDAIVRVGPGQFRSMRAEANAMLLSLPNEWRQRYLTQFARLARRSLSEALEKSDYAAVANVANRYLLTESGILAARVLATRHMDRGEFALAMRWFKRMQEFGWEPATTADKLHLAKATRLLGLTSATVKGAVNVGGQQVSANDLLTQVKVSDAGGRNLADWPMLMGTASRHGLATDRLPILVKAWQQPLMQGSVARGKAVEVQQQVLAGSNVTVPSAMPIVVGSKVACRTPDGVSVFDARSGKMLWRTELEEQTQRIVEGTSPSAFRVRSTYRNGESMLTSFLFRDAAHGLIGSDGARLFVLQDQEAISPSRILFSRRSAVDPAASTNVLAAYNIEDGSIAWRIGGPASTEPFRSTMAGYYFHGVPVAHLGELFVIAEKATQVSLVCLDASTGELKWSLPLGFSDTEIGRDGTRRHWAAQVTVAGGLMLCPNNADWLVAVDPVTRSIAWLTRYRRSQSSGVAPPNSGNTRPMASLANQWPVAAPIVVGSTAIYTPTEVSSMIAVDLATGRQLWQQPKGPRLYLAGSSGPNVIVVGVNFVECLRAADGRQQWKQSLRTSKIAGRGVVTASHFHVPLSSGEIVSLDLKSGDINHRTRMSRGSPLVANMVMHASGTLLQSPTDIEAFALRTPKDAVPATPAEELRAAEILLADGDIDAALNALDRIDASKLDKIQISQRDSALRDCLQWRIEEGKAGTDADMKRLAELGLPPSALARLAILSGTARGEYDAAFRQLIELYRSPDAESVSEAGISIRSSVWLAARLQDVFQQLSPEQRESLGDLVTQVRDEGGPEQLDRFLDTFGFHVSARDGLNERFATLLGAGRFAEAESELVRLRRVWPERVSDAVAELAAALNDAGQCKDAVALLKSNRLAADVVELQSPATTDSNDVWTNAVWSVQQLGVASRGSASAEYSVYHPDNQFSHDTAIVSDPLDAGRLHFQRISDGSIYWSVSLGGSIQAIIPNGRCYLIVQRERLVALAPQERRQLWERPLAIPGVYWSRVFQPLVRPSGTYPNDRPTQLPVVNVDYVCFRDQQSIKVLDAVTGTVRWSRDDINPGARVFGTTDAVIVVEGQGATRILRALDGKELDGSLTPADGIIGGMGTNLVCRTATGLPLFRTLILRSVNPLTGELAWRHRFSGEPDSARVNDSQIVVRHGNRKVSLIDLPSGEKTDFEASSPFTKGEYSAAVTDRHVVMVHTGDDVTFSRSTAQVIEKEIRAFDRASAEEAWMRQTNKARVSTRSLQWMPIVVLMDNRRERSFPRIGTLEIWDTLLLDAATGKELISQSMSTRLNRAEVFVDHVRHFIEIATASRRYRFDAKLPRRNAATTQPPEK